MYFYLFKRFAILKLPVISSFFSQDTPYNTEICLWNSLGKSSCFLEFYLKIIERKMGNFLSQKLVWRIFVSNKDDLTFIKIRIFFFNLLIHERKFSKRRKIKRWEKVEEFEEKARQSFWENLSPFFLFLWRGLEKIIEFLSNIPTNNANL